MGVKFKAIKTTYNGTKFKSRFEANVAMLLDKMNRSWEYEPESFLLPSGHYMPDFRYMQGGEMYWVEARGYESKDWQLTEFYRALPRDNNFIVFKKNEIGIFEHADYDGWCDVVYILHRGDGSPGMFHPYSPTLPKECPKLIFDILSCNKGMLFINSDTVHTWRGVERRSLFDF